MIEGETMVGKILENKHNGRRITITEKIISDTGNIMYLADDEKFTVLADHDMKHWFEVPTAILGDEEE